MEDGTIPPRKKKLLSWSWMVKGGSPVVGRSFSGTSGNLSDDGEQKNVG